VARKNKKHSHQIQKKIKNLCDNILELSHFDVTLSAPKEHYRINLCTLLKCDHKIKGPFIERKYVLFNKIYDGVRKLKKYNKRIMIIWLYKNHQVNIIDALPMENFTKKFPITKLKYFKNNLEHEIINDLDELEDKNILTINYKVLPKN